MSSSWRRAAMTAAVVTAVTAPAGFGLAGTTASAAPSWAPASRATVHPGVHVTIAGVRCVAGFVLTDGRRVFLTVPASCTGVSYGDPTDGCTEAQVPPGLPVSVQGARYPGTVAYSSFTRMQLLGLTGSNRCHNNNLSLIRLDPRDVKRTNPSVPLMGGPTGVSRDQPASPDLLNVLLDGAASKAQAVSSTAGGWAHTMLAAGQVDRSAVGSPVLTDDGRALGMISVIPWQGTPGESTVTDLGRELQFLQRMSRFADVHLARGTRSFVAPSGTVALSGVATSLVSR